METVARHGMCRNRGAFVGEVEKGREEGPEVGLKESIEVGFKESIDAL